MARAISSSEAVRVLIPMNLCKTYIAGVAPGCFSDRVRTLDGRMLYKPTFSKIK